MFSKNSLLLTLGLLLLSSQTFADDNSMPVTPDANIQTYIHRPMIGSGQLVSSTGVINTSGTLYITQSIATDAPCDGTDSNGQSNAHPMAVIQLKDTGQMQVPGHSYGDERCYISRYDIDAADAKVTRNSNDITSKSFTLSIPFSVQQGGDWHSGIAHQGTFHECGSSSFPLTGFAIQYSIYCVPNN